MVLPIEKETPETPTPAMTAAGVLELAHYSAAEDDPSDVVLGIYAAMLAARDASKPLDCGRTDRETASTA